MKTDMLKELGKWLMDVAKYMATAILLSSLFTSFNGWRWYNYAFLILAIIFTLIVGLYLSNRKEKQQ